MASLSNYIREGAPNPLTLGYAHVRAREYFSNRLPAQKDYYKRGQLYGAKFNKIEQYSDYRTDMMLIVVGALLLTTIAIVFPLGLPAASDYALIGGLCGGLGGLFVILGGGTAVIAWRKGNALKREEVDVEVLVAEIFDVVNNRRDWEQFANEIRPPQEN